MRPSRHSILISSTALATAVLLSGCVPTASDSPTPRPSASASSSATPSASPTANPEPTPTAEIIRFTAACDSLITPEALYAIDPNLGMLGPIDPDSGTPAADVVAAGGVACRWTHTTSGATLDVAVAELPRSAATGIKDRLAVESNSVPTYEVEGYFRVNGSLGEANAFPDPYWVSIVSPMFLEPGDALPFMEAVTPALG